MTAPTVASCLLTLHTPVGLVYRLMATQERAEHIEPQLLTVNVPNIPQQGGNTNCDIYAIAYVYHSARKEDITQIIFRQDVMIEMPPCQMLLPREAVPISKR